MKLSIEDILSQSKTDNFPFSNKKDYKSIYTILKKSFDNEIHKEISQMMKQYHEDYYFNDHGVEHIKMVIDRCERILKYFDSKGKFDLTEYEIFILLIAINIHDAGHLIGIRDEHTRKARELLSNFDKSNLLSKPEIMIIGNIAKAHGGKNNPIGSLEETFPNDGHKIRPKLLAAILRLGDELAEDETRTSRFLLDSDNIPKNSEVFHKYSASLYSLNIEDGTISLSFSFNKKFLNQKLGKLNSEVFLLDEIYDRTVKTFQETLYCSKFFSENTRVDSIKVKIEILDDFNECVEEIKYTLEYGYPFEFNIYKICPSLYDGQYYFKKYNS